MLIHRWPRRAPIGDVSRLAHPLQQLFLQLRPLRRSPVSFNLKAAKKKISVNL
jgi:hypothetical protein